MNENAAYLIIVIEKLSLLLENALLRGELGIGREFPYDYIACL